MIKTTLELAIPEQHPCYADHFPGHPLVPGALLLQWIFSEIGKIYPDITITEVRLAKFLNAVLPGDHCQLDLEIKPDFSLMRITCISNGKLACTCKLILTPSPLGQS